MATRGKRIVIVRHGERVDHRFQDVWVEKCFDKEGNYTRQNLNQPEKLPQRKGYPQTFIRDSPLTEIGCLQATLRGQGIATENILSEGFEVYVSPSYRCVKTTANILKAMGGSENKMKVEPCLFEWTQLPCYVNGSMPNWMTVEELQEANFNVDKNYIPYITAAEMREMCGETRENYYDRSHKLVLRIIEATGNKDILLVAHGFSIEVLTRQLLGSAVRDTEELNRVVRNVPYCGMVTLEQSLTDDKTWNVLPISESLQLTHASAHEFDAHKAFYPCETT